jgi:hypothetical protein
MISQCINYVGSNRLTVDNELGRITIVLAVVYMETITAIPWRNWGKMENLRVRPLDMKES